MVPVTVARRLPLRRRYARALAAWTMAVTCGSAVQAAGAQAAAAQQVALRIAK